MIFFVKLYYPYAARTVRGCLDPGGEGGGGGGRSVPQTITLKLFMVLK